VRSRMLLVLGPVLLPAASNEGGLFLPVCVCVYVLWFVCLVGVWCDGREGLEGGREGGWESEAVGQMQVVNPCSLPPPSLVRAASPNFTKNSRPASTTTTRIT